MSAIEAAVGDLDAELAVLSAEHAAALSQAGHGRSTTRRLKSYDASMEQEQHPNPAALQPPSHTLSSCTLSAHGYGLRFAM